MRYKNYIFDLYGTLIDIHTDENDPELWKFTVDYLDSHFGVKTTARKLKADYKKICAEEVDKLAKLNGSAHPEIKIEWVWEGLLGVPCSDAEMLDLCTAFREKSRVKFQLYPGVLDVFDKIRAGGGKIYLLSNAQRIFTERELKLTGILDAFDDIFISSDMGIKKPDPNFIDSLMKKHSLVPSESVMIGNEVFADMGSAAAAGIDGIYLNTYNHRLSEIKKHLRKCGATESGIEVTIIDEGNECMKYVME